MKRQYEILVSWVAFPLHPDTPDEGLSLQELFAGKEIDIKAMRDRLKQVALQEGLPFGDRDRTYNSRLAQELGKWAESRGRGDPFHAAVFRSYFAAGENIAKISVLTKIADSVDLPAMEAEKVLISRSFKQAVDKDWSRSYAMNVRAVPTFMIKGQTMVGAQPYGSLDQLLRDNNVMRRPSSS